MIDADGDEYLEFVYTPEFIASVDDLLTAEDVREIEIELLTDPGVGKVIPGTGGVRKMRFALPGRGKSGGIRVLYVHAAREQRIYFLLAYPKNVRGTLTQGEKNALKQWVQQL